MLTELCDADNTTSWRGKKIKWFWKFFSAL